MIHDFPEPVVDILGGKGDETYGKKGGDVDLEIDFGVSVNGGGEEGEAWEEGIEEGSLGIPSCWVGELCLGGDSACPWWEAPRARLIHVHVDNGKKGT